MASEDLTVRLKADDQLTPVVKKAAKAVDELAKEDVELKVDVDVKPVDAALDAVRRDVEKTGDEFKELKGDTSSALSGVATDVEQAGGEFGELRRDVEKTGDEFNELERDASRALREIDTGGASRGLRGVRDDVDRTEGAFGKLKAGASSVFGGLGGIVAGGVAAAGAAIGTFALKAVGDFQEVALQAGKMSDKLGLSTEDASRLAEVVGDIGVEVGTFEAALGRMNLTAAKTPEKFEAIGAAIARSKDGTVDVVQTFKNAAEAINEIPDAAQRAKAAQDIFGKGWGAIAELIKGGAKGIAAAMESVEKGKVISPEEVQKAREFRDTMDELKGAFESFSIEAGGHIIRVINGLGEMKTAAEEVIRWVTFRDARQLIDKNLVEPLTAGAEDIEASYSAVGSQAIQTAKDLELLGDSDPTPGMATAAAALVKTGPGLTAQGFTVKMLQETYARAAEAAQGFADIVGSTDFAMADVAGGLTAMGLFNDMLFAQDNQIIKNEESFKALSESVKENGANFDVSTEAGHANQGALEGVARSLEDDLAAAYAAANGNQETFMQSAGAIADFTLARLQEELGLSAAETLALGAELGLLPADLQTRYELSGTEEAKAKIGLLQTSIDLLPKDVQTKVTQQIIAGDYVGALATIQNYYNSHPATVKVTPVMVGFDQGVRRGNVVIHDAGGTVGPGGGIAGESGPEFIRLPDGREVLLTGTSYVPPRTRVTSTKRTRQILSRRGLPRYANGTGADGSVEVKTKDDPNTAILQKISDTLLGIASWDKTANSILAGELKYLIQAVQSGSFDPSIVRGAVMAIGAGAA